MLNAFTIDPIAIKAHQAVTGDTEEETLQHYRQKQITLELRQNETYTDMLRCIREYGMCNIVRPTGFGKTYLFAKYAASQSGKVLYIYDVTSARDGFINTYSPKNVDFISYARLSRAETAKETMAEILAGNYQTVIFDESHLMGGENISNLLAELIPQLFEKGTVILGGTATDVRTDGVNVTDQFFQSVSTYEYTIEDAFKDGIIEIPLYSVMIYSYKLLDNAKKKCKNSPRALRELTQLEKVYAKRHGEAEIYREQVLNLYGEVPERMKFIAFYPTIKSMEDTLPTLKREFKAAFPERDILVVPFSSDPAHTLNRELVYEQTPPKNTIMLITAVDMLNQSYHSDDLTGIIMNRSTTSDVLFVQQLGRCLSVNNSCPAIVFDNVANCEQNWTRGLKDEELPVPSENPGQGRGANGELRRAEGYVHGEYRTVPQWTRRIGNTYGTAYGLTPQVASIEESLLRATQRIIQSRGITDEQISKAMKAYAADATFEFIKKLTGVPAWLLLNELGERDLLESIDAASA